jgi:hypothetical protein
MRSTDIKDVPLSCSHSSKSSQLTFTVPLTSFTGTTSSLAIKADSSFETLRHSFTNFNETVLHPSTHLTHFHTNFAMSYTHRRAEMLHRLGIEQLPTLREPQFTAEVDCTHQVNYPIGDLPVRTMPVGLVNPNVRKFDS